jgi:hypothetical protein
MKLSINMNIIFTVFSIVFHVVCETLPPPPTPQVKLTWCRHVGTVCPAVMSCHVRDVTEVEESKAV